MSATSAQERGRRRGCSPGPRSVALACHVGPDGDALGSMLALGARPCAALGKEVVASWGERAVRGAVDATRFLPGLGPAGAAGGLPRAAPSVLVTLDTGSARPARRCSPTASRRRACCIVVDHHATTRASATVNLVDADAAATAVLVARADRPARRRRSTATSPPASTPGWSPTPGRSSTRHHARGARARRAAARDRHPARRDRRASCGTRAPFGYVKLLGAALGAPCSSRTRSAARAGTCVARRRPRASRPRPRRRRGRHRRRCARADEAEVAVVLKERPGRGRLRRCRPGPRARVDVGAVCTALGGGGHRFAAGFTSARRRRRDHAPAVAPRSTRLPHRCRRGPRPRAACSSSTSPPAGPPTTSSARVPAPGRHPQGRPRRHARPDGDRRAGRSASDARPGCSATSRSTDKAYDATIRLGATTVTDDAEGEVVEQRRRRRRRHRRGRCRRRGRAHRRDRAGPVVGVSAVKVDGCGRTRGSAPARTSSWRPGR